ncbi:hypothetical protein PVAND_007727 [Polypedilum vanderplanki]|uniref:F-box domain-containing protein n=1 Tax=Polypedilum vanderplanki TaxID=319348 RepID=A0A9J6C7K3_POLVA|nr:hypothetical protein PVAND_007727 [Polypedilum vanderplanki]
MTRFINFNNLTTIALRKRKNETEIDDRMKKRARFNEMTINSMPNELLWEIFSLLDRDSLLNANLVNKNWNNLICSTSLVEKIDKLYITAEKVDNFIPDLTRKYTSVRFDDIVDWSSELMEQLKAIGKCITNVTFVECVFFGNDIINLLQMFPYCKFMEISCCYEGCTPYEKYTSFPFRKVEMKSLKTVVLRGYSWPLSYISTPNLKRLEVETLGKEDQETLIIFLNTLKELRTLHLVDIHDLFDSRCGTIRTPKFKLKELLMVNLPLMDSDQMIRFLRHMKDSVTLLELGSELNVRVCEYILLNFNNIYSLNIDYECFPRARSFYQKMEMNKNLKYLALYGNMRSSKQLMYFLKRNTCVEELLMSELHGLHPNNYEFWHQFSSLVPNLHTLCVRRINVYNMVFIKLKNLKHLDVEYIGYATCNSWIQFCLNNPKIESFHIFARYQDYFKNIEYIIRGSLNHLNDFFSN